MEKEKEKLVLDNINLAYSIAYKYKDKVTRSWDFDDVKQICLEGLMQAADTYDNSRNIAFSTYAYTVIRNFIIDASMYETKKLGSGILSLDETYEEDITLLNLIPDEFDIEDYIVQKSRKELLHTYIDQLPELEKAIMKLRCEEKTFKDIATLLDKNEKVIHVYYQKGLNMLRNKFIGGRYE